MNKAAFLDRDGTINVDKDYLYKIDDFEYLPYAIDGLKLLQDQGYMLVIVTNQSGIARGYYSEDDYLRLDSWMKADLATKGVKITGSYYCPHLPEAPMQEYSEDCDCRKPKSGLFFRAAKELEINIDLSIAIGDRLRDLAICENTRCKGILISEEAQELPNRVIRVSNWKDFVENFDRIK